MSPIAVAALACPVSYCFASIPNPLFGGRDGFPLIAEHSNFAFSVRQGKESLDGVETPRITDFGKVFVIVYFVGLNSVDFNPEIVKYFRLVDGFHSFSCGLSRRLFAPIPAYDVPPIFWRSGRNSRR